VLQLPKTPKQSWHIKLGDAPKLTIRLPDGIKGVSGSAAGSVATLTGIRADALGNARPAEIARVSATTDELLWAWSPGFSEVDELRRQDWLTALQELIIEVDSHEQEVWLQFRSPVNGGTWNLTADRFSVRLPEDLHGLGHARLEVAGGVAPWKYERRAGELSDDAIWFLRDDLQFQIGRDSDPQELRTTWGYVRAGLREDNKREKAALDSVEKQIKDLDMRLRNPQLPHDQKAKMTANFEGLGKKKQAKEDAIRLIDDKIKRLSEIPEFSIIGRAPTGAIIFTVDVDMTN
jgi:hypothetical protein